MNDYEAFLNSKKLTTVDTGKVCGELHPAMTSFRGDIVRWAVRKGRAAIFADVGLGKTTMYCEWTRQLNERTLILTPLAVAQQTVDMAAKLLDMELRYVRSMADVDFESCKFYVTNYEMLAHFDASQFQAVVLDESSILKAFSGTTKKLLISTFKDTPYKLACTATPAPNDLLEIGNHADFLGVMSSRLMTSIFFTHDSQSAKSSSGNKYRLKKHATGKFYEWLASWAVALKKPSDLGYDDTGYLLPELRIELKTVNAGYTPAGMLTGFGVQSISAVDAKKVRRTTILSRAELAISQITSSSAQYLVWTGLNDEAAHLTKHIPDSFDLHGALKPDEKVQAIQDFVQGNTRVLVTKSSIAGMGVNMQQCANMLFFGVDYSWEQFYQSIGRIYRFGQRSDVVNVTVITSEEERSVFETIQRKGEEAKKMTDELIKASAAHMRENIRGEQHGEWTYREDEASGKNWRMLLGDSCQRMKEIPDDSVHLEIESPPFGNGIFIYSATEHDVGNATTMEKFIEHYGFIVREKLRILMPGRYSCVHIQDTKVYGLNNNGNRGLYPLSDEIVRLHIEAGWTFRSRITIDKNPQLVATRNHDNDLLFITGKRDGCDLAPMNTDYLLVFEKPGKNPVPVKPYDNGDMTEDEWITWARACWYDIRETDVLNVDVARTSEDERHLCPLQLPLIGRCVRMWSNPGETLFSPFGGIGSESYEALRWKRKALSIELKPEYFRVAVRNLENAETEFGGRTLLDLLPAEAAGD
jgi:DNA modification methylase/superfamily II DNA or RNA helicase